MLKDRESAKLGIWKEVVDVAYQDDHITIEESKLLKILLDNAEVYRNVLEKAFEDGHLSKEDKEELLQQRERIKESAYETAEEDEKISEDELAIIQKALEIIDTLELNEHHLSSYWT